MRKTLLTALAALSLALAATTAQAASLTQGFDDITTLPGEGWVLQNNSSPSGTINWFQGNSTVFPAFSGGVTSYIGANFNNTSNVGTISNFLITPTLTFFNGDTISFFTRTVTEQIFPDRLEVRLSGAGTSSDTGTTATSVGVFTNLLGTINPDLTVAGYPNAWTQFSFTLSGLGADGSSGRLAFRYFVTSAGPLGDNSDYIGIDSLAITPSSQIPEPSTVAALGLFTVAYFRRRQKQ